MTTTNTDMVIVQTAMGRHVAAFAYPNEAWEYAVDMIARDHLSFVRPIDGKAERYSEFADYGEFVAWVLNA